VGISVHPPTRSTRLCYRSTEREPRSRYKIVSGITVGPCGELVERRDGAVDTLTTDESDGCSGFADSVPEVSVIFVGTPGTINSSNDTVGHRDSFRPTLGDFAELAVHSLTHLTCVTFSN